jgi:hypothetical protein
MPRYEYDEYRRLVGITDYEKRDEPPEAENLTQRKERVKRIARQKFRKPTQGDAVLVGAMDGRGQEAEDAEDFDSTLEWPADFKSQQDPDRYLSSPEQARFQAHARTPSEYADISASAPSPLMAEAGGPDRDVRASAENLKADGQVAAVLDEAMGSSQQPEYQIQGHGWEWTWDDKHMDYIHITGKWVDD